VSLLSLSYLFSLIIIIMVILEMIMRHINISVTVTHSINVVVVAYLILGSLSEAYNCVASLGKGYILTHGRSQTLMMDAWICLA
jgi:hypothetical protein